MTVFTASTTADVQNFLAIVKPGDTIQLNPGTYSNLVLQNVSTSNVTITSVYPNNPAVLTDLLARNLSGFNFTNLEMYATKDMPFQVYNSNNIVLDHLDVHGTIGGDPSDDVRGLLVRNSKNVTVSNSYFHELSDGLSHLNDGGITFTGNKFELIRDNGIIGGGTSYMVVSNNLFTNFDHIGTVHPDAIQFYTLPTTTQSTNIYVSGNVYNRGSGTAVQGIWINDDSGYQPYKNLTVTNNVMIGAVFNGIAIVGAVNATVTGNVVTGETDQNSWLAIQNVSQAYVANNLATDFAFINSNITGGGDVATSYLSPNDAANLSGWLDGATTPGQLTAKTSASAAATVLANVYQIGFVDGASPNGITHAFTVLNYYGTSGSDVLAAYTYGTSHLYGYDGNDFLSGSKNGLPSTLEGGLGDDTYNIYQSNDVVIENPGAGTDTVYTYANYTIPANVEIMRAVAPGITLTGNSGDNLLVAASGGDTLVGGGGNDTLQGWDGKDIIIAGTGNAKLYGNDGNDQLSAVGGNNYLSGGNGNDVLVGGSGNDTLEGGPGIDIMNGMGGADTFVYRASDFAAGVNASKDIIIGFSVARGDIINLQGVDPIIKTSANEAFKFIGTAAFDGAPGELRYVAEGDGITVYGDTTGDKVADIAIHLSGLTSISSNAFLL